ncbi:MAG: hypothetical protein IJ799_08725 [Bacteroidales bacterium]|nr:hypothetical protein [Bacteroidales bacterium]
MAALSAVLPGCVPARPERAAPEVEVPPAPVERKGSVIFLSYPVDYRVDSIDLFLFSDSGTQPLELHRRTCLKDTFCFSSAPGDKEAVLIANCPYAFNLAAVPNLDALEQLRFSFSEDNPQAPLMSAVLNFEAGGTAKAVLQPLMCRVVIESVSNMMSGYRRLEDPSAFLSGMNPEAELLRSGGFAAIMPQTDTVRAALPCDIGIFTQYPGTELFCYPNDPGDASPASPPTLLHLEGACGGDFRRLSFALPPLHRGCTVRAAISFDETNSSVSFR